MIFMKFTKSWFNNKKSSNSRPKICRIIRVKFEKLSLMKNSQNLLENA